MANFGEGSYDTIQKRSGGVRLWFAYYIPRNAMHTSPLCLMYTYLLGYIPWLSCYRHVDWHVQRGQVMHQAVDALSVLRCTLPWVHGAEPMLEVITA